MQNRLVAGTVILNGKDGHKKFLLKKNQEKFDFIMTSIDEKQTSLAYIIEALKEDAGIDLDKINLVELANIQVDGGKTPLFVFEMEEKDLSNNALTQYGWELPSTLREVLDFHEVSGVPIFQ